VRKAAEKRNPAAAMKIEMRGLHTIRPYENNPRINDSAVDAVAASIREFGWKQPIVIDKNSVIIAGHTRWRAAQRLGLQSVPVLVATDLTDQQVKAYRLADNRSAELADWDFSKLAVELDGIDDALKASLADLNFDALQTQIPVEPESLPEFPEVNENIDTEHTCPKCGYKWSGGK
jgi:site-specific DNA-methyltransferase (adenine-specific)